MATVYWRKLYKQSLIDIDSVLAKLKNLAWYDGDLFLWA